MAFTGPYSRLKECTYCGEAQYKTPDSQLPHCQFTTLPLGPQLQALWRHLESVAKIRERLTHMEALLAEHDNGGIELFDDIYCSSKYLELVSSGKLKEDDDEMNRMNDRFLGDHIYICISSCTIVYTHVYT
ncbi:hypothetical protein L218DRAFT_953199 [Marasmius fiardii PR-910]|nr:hypothetical protein L218DRAFT_953199 [Marasmius fiardii PR-910]